MASAIYDAVTTKELHIVDNVGRTKVLIWTSQAEESTPFIHLYDNEGRVRLELSLDVDGTPHITLWDEKNMLSGSMGLSTKHGSAGISFLSSNAKHHVSLGVHNKGIEVNFGDRPYEDEEDVDVSPDDSCDN